MNTTKNATKNTSKNSFSPSPRKTKYIFVTGGVASSLGKGIVSASLAKLLQSRGFSVTIQKFDPYLNIDPGTLNPYEHGECYVTDDGAETDLDLGHYERFLNVSTSQANNVTTGRIYNTVINKERKGDFLGKTVQVIPHITDEIKRNFYFLGETGKYDIIITEIGGCIGDIESLPFVEAVRQARWELGEQNSLVIHLTLVPYLSAAKELKTKPTQHSVKMLSEQGVQPDVLVCRTEHALPDDIRRKISQFCNVNIKSVIESIDADTIYDVPLLMRKEHLDDIVLEKLGLPTDSTPNLEEWKHFLGKLKNPTDEVKIALVGKYVELPDAYKSIVESFIHAGAETETKVKLKWVSSEDLDSDDDVKKYLSTMDGILVAPGFGDRGIEGKVLAVKYARENKIPFFGICLGMQVSVIEFARNVLKLEGAHSAEMNPETEFPVIDLMKDQKDVTTKGGTMRLGAYPCQLKKNSLASQVYNGKDLIHERHRHRYEFNNTFLKDFEKAGLLPTGINPESNLVEIVEMKQSEHPYFVGVQFHPELKSTALSPHPLFVGFIKAALAKRLEEVVE
ncbi:CTP synthase [Bernardetia litoralis DSM 6794]|uniref:CTP synthase n=1 Tax=Bernardetia litoralis (strain ATCC 23117 / DSM 6794 / NBRC 15988 / NCIMB 1366 / Fx l1 / Sio-4) TaxID=880071 RepID=I4ALT9_BERLS|nr:CTP synthase [Bernardetia litoralis]AFM04924.1 CTP synthase [Bernardetia litoralis DSM 6794]